MHPTRLASSFLLFAALAALPAAARPRRRAPARHRKTAVTAIAASARRHAESARILFELQEYDGAVDEWKEAYRLKPAPLLLFNIAQATRMSGRLGEARRAYIRYLDALDAGKVPKSGPARSEVVLRIAELDAKLPPTEGGTSRRPVVAAAAEAPPAAINDAAAAPRTEQPEPAEQQPLGVRADLLVPDLRGPVRAAPSPVLPPEEEPPLPVYTAPMRPAQVVAAGLGTVGAALGVAAAFHQFQARSLEADALAIERPRNELDARLREADAFGTQALWYGSGAVVAGAAALAVWWWDRSNVEHD
jgi:hypothetical protein